MTADAGAATAETVVQALVSPPREMRHTMAQESVAVIGAGIGGLSAACHALINGYDVDLFEMHSRPGGLCTAWARNGFTFDGCLHFVIGTHPAGPVHDYWQTTGAFDGVELATGSEYVRYEGRDGRTVVLYRDADRLEEHLCALFPADSDTVRGLCDDIRLFAANPLVYREPPELAPRWDIKGGRPANWLVRARKLNAVSVARFTDGLSDPLLQRALRSVVPPNYAVSALVMTLAAFHAGDGARPVGGSETIVNAMARRVRLLGGRIHTDTRVTGVLVEGERACGVGLSDGTELRSDQVISTTDPFATFQSLLPNPWRDKRSLLRLASLVPREPVAQVSLGIAADLHDSPHYVLCEQDRLLLLAGKEHEYLPLRLFGHADRVCGEGRAVVTCLVHSSWDHWAGLSNDGSAYRAEKQRVAEAVAAAVVRRLPAAHGRVGVVDVATPLTHERFTGVWHGAYEGWDFTPEASAVALPRTVPGLKGFTMAGQWLIPGGGVTAAMVSGRWAVQVLCARGKREFATHTPIQEKMSHGTVQPS